MNPPPSSLDLVILEQRIEGENGLALKNEFLSFFTWVEEWQGKVANISDPKLARESRLALKTIRCDAEKVRKRLKTEVLAYGAAIDGCYRLIETAVVPLEAKLIGIEQAAELAAKAQREAIRKERGDKLRPYLPAVDLIGLEEMPEAQFLQLLDSVKTAHEAKIEGHKKAEEARVRQEEQDRILAEKLRKAQEEEQARQAAENARLKAEKDAADAANRALVEEADKLRREIAAQAKAEADRLAAEIRKNSDRMAAEKKAERDRIAAQEAEAKKAASAPDRQKLLAVADTFQFTVLPKMTTTQGQAAVDAINDGIDQLVAFIRDQAKTL